jgi:hypothetical protein
MLQIYFNHRDPFASLYDKYYINCRSISISCDSLFKEKKF